MSLAGFLPTNRNAEADQSSLEYRSPTYNSNVTTPTHTDGADSPNNIMRASNVSVSGRDSMTLPDETLGVAETSKVGTPRYSKCPSDKLKFSPHFSFV